MRGVGVQLLSSIRETLIAHELAKRRERRAPEHQEYAIRPTLCWDGAERFGPTLPSWNSFGAAAAQIDGCVSEGALCFFRRAIRHRIRFGYKACNVEPSTQYSPNLEFQCNTHLLILMTISGLDDGIADILQ